MRYTEYDIIQPFKVTRIVDFGGSTYILDTVINKSVVCNLDNINVLRI